MTTKVRQSTVQQDNIKIDWLSDVDTSTAAPTNGQALVYNSTTTKWEPGSVASSGGASSSGNTSFVRTSFTATAGQTTFTATYAVGFVTVYYNGVLLASADYTATTGSTIVLAVGALVGDIVEIIAYTGAAAAGNTTRTYSGTGSQTTFTVTIGMTVNSVLVTENGILQVPTTDYTISSTTLTFTTAPASGVAIQIRELNNVAPSQGTLGTVALFNNTIDSNVTISSGKNGLSIGPVTVANGVSVTVASGQRWVII